MAGRSLGPWRLRPERQDAEERVWAIWVAPDRTHQVVVAELAWSRPRRRWVLTGLPPMQHRERCFTPGSDERADGYWPVVVPERVWEHALAEAAAWTVAALKAELVRVANIAPGRSDSGEASA